MVLFFKYTITIGTNIIRFGRGSFVESQKVHDKECETVNWTDIRFITFDHPEPFNPTINFEPEQDYSLNVTEQLLYEQRFKNILANLSLEHPFNVS